MAKGITNKCYPLYVIYKSLALYPKTDSLKTKGWTMVFHANHPKVIDAVAILISDEIDFNKSVFFFFLNRMPKTDFCVNKRISKGRCNSYSSI